MLFNSLGFVAFFTVVTFAYFILPHRFRWILLLAASYFFYGCWKPAYLALIASSTLVTYYTGLKMGETDAQARRIPYMVTSLVIRIKGLVRNPPKMLPPKLAS